MIHFVAGFVTALLLGLIGVIIYFMKGKSLREQITSFKDEIDIKGILHERFKKDILEKRLPTDDPNILRRFDELKCSGNE